MLAITAPRSSPLERLRDIRRKVTDTDAQPAAPHFTVFDQLLHDGYGHVTRHREADADVTSRRRKDRRIDTDQPAVGVTRGTAGIARID